MSSFGLIEENIELSHIHLAVPSIINTGEPADFIEKSDLVVV